MIPSQADDINVRSTVTGEKIAMSFDENSLTHLMSVLTDLYSDPEMAVLREYSTNARDSHIEAAQTRPIEIVLPSTLNPFLHVKDFGVGLDQQDIEEIYSKYGASTKRETNEQTGVLGLGCKSALTYGPQFSLVGIKNNVRTMVSIARDEDGAGSMTIVEAGATEEPNGVEIIIPARRYSNFEYKAQQLFRFWEEGTVLVNGKEPESVEGMRVGDDLLVAERLDSHYIVMGNVPYPVEFSTPLSHQYKLVLFAGIGEVNFTPSREALQYTKRTKERIALAEREFQEAMKAAIQKEIDEATSPRDAFYRSIKWRSALPRLNMDLTYKDQEVPAEFTAPEGEKILVTAARSNTLSHHSKFATITAPTLLNGVIVYGYNMSNFTASHKKKLTKWAQENGKVPESFVLTHAKMESIWLDPSSMVDWDTVKAIRLEIAGRSGGEGRIKGSYDLWEQGHLRHEVAAEEIDGSLPLFYFTTYDFKEDGRGEKKDDFAVSLVTQYFPDCTVVIMGSNRVTKFCRDFPSARNLLTVLAETYDKLADELDEDILKAFVYQNRHGIGRFGRNQLNPALIDDPELAKAVTLLQTSGSKISEAIDPLREFGRLMRFLSISDRLSGENVPDLLTNYPLLEGISYTSREHPHLYLYVNAAYAAAQTEKEQDPS